MPWAFFWRRFAPPRPARGRMMRRPRTMAAEDDAHGHGPDEEDPAAPPAPLARRLPAEDPDRARLRRGHRTPLEVARSLSKRLGNQVLLKREDTQPVFSFKLRGAYNKMAHLSPAQLQARRDLRLGRQPRAGRGARRAALGCKAVIVMPVTTPQAQGRRGARARRRGRAARRQLLRRLRARARAQKQHGLTFVHPFDDPDVIAGQGTIAMEILRQHQGPIDAVFVAIGGGGLISGVAVHQVGAARDQGDRRADERLRRDAALGQAPASACSCTTSACSPTAPPSSWSAKRPSASRASWSTSRRRRHRRRLRRDQGRVPGHPQHPRARRRARRGRRSSSTSTRTSCKGKTFVAITCGANMNFDRLRFVAERAEVGESARRCSR
jgi:threonine dehydratase